MSRIYRTRPTHGRHAPFAPPLAPWVHATVETKSTPSPPLPFARPRSAQERRLRAQSPPTLLPQSPLAPVPPSTLLGAISIQTDHPISFLTPCRNSHASSLASIASLSSAPPASTSLSSARAATSEQRVAGDLRATEIRVTDELRPGNLRGIELRIDEH
jgi:hypothetical protein